MATISTDDLVNFQKLASEVAPIWGTHPNAQAGWWAPGYSSLASMCTTAGQANGSVFHDYVDCTTSWFWTFVASGNSRYDKRIQARGLRTFILVGGVWEEVGTERRLAVSQATNWNGSNLTSVWSGGSHPSTEDNGANGHSWPISNSNVGIEAWGDGFYNAPNRSKTITIEGYASICEARIINTDGTAYSGTDCRMMAQLGMDYYNSNRNTPGSGAATALKDNEGRPKSQMDGGNGRWVLINSGEWRSVACITMLSYAQRPNPFAGYTGTWPYDDVPLVLTEAQVRANTPNFSITTPGGGGGGGGGGATGEITAVGGDFSATTTVTVTPTAVGASGGSAVVMSIFPKTATTSTVTSGWTESRVNSSYANGAQAVYYKNGANSANLVVTFSAAIGGSWVALTDDARPVTPGLTSNQGDWDSHASTKALSTTTTYPNATVIATHSASDFARKAVFPDDTLITNQGVDAESRPTVAIGKREVATPGASGDITIWPYQWSATPPTSGPDAGGTERWISRAFIFESSAAASPVAVFTGTAAVSVQSALPTATITNVQNDSGAVVQDGGETEELTPFLNGTIAAPLLQGQAVQIYRNNLLSGIATSNATNWTFSDVLTAVGTYQYVAVVVQDAEVGGASPPYTITIRQPSTRPSIASGGGGGGSIVRPSNSSW